MTIAEIHQLFLECKSISIDTRKIESGSMFVAIKGDNFDANTFAKEAFAKGAKYVIIDNNDYYIDDKTILVEDSLTALQELAMYHRKYLRTPIIALTGSNGKTTTKELINVVLSKKFKTAATVGNLNNHIGVPLTLLSFTKETQLGIVEMGANHQQEIEFLCQLARPDYGYITNFGKAHLEGFGGIEGVIKGKSEMYQYLQREQKTVFVNLDDPIQVEKTKNLEKFRFGVNNTVSELNITAITANPLVEVSFDNITIKSNLIGLYNANNINAAVLIGQSFKITNNDIKDAIESYVPENNRSQLVHKGSNEIILDAYNANPSSMKVAIENFVQLKNDKKLMILGDMFELGEESHDEHREIVKSVDDFKNTTCYFVGNYFYDCKIESENLTFFKDFAEFSMFFASNKPESHIILIKGSRGMALEKTLTLL